MVERSQRIIRISDGNPDTMKTMKFVAHRIGKRTVVGSKVNIAPHPQALRTPSHNDRPRLQSGNGLTLRRSSTPLRSPFLAQGEILGSHRAQKLHSESVRPTPPSSLEHSLYDFWTLTVFGHKDMTIEVRAITDASQYDACTLLNAIE